jgi:hypothetical protein
MERAVHSQPQGDGDCRPFGDGPRRLVHAEKSGPAFDRETETVRMLMQSIQSQAIKAAGEAIDAIRRCSLPDLCAAWPRLLRIAGVTSRGALVYRHKPYVWADMREAVELALCYAEQPDSLKWQEADAFIRGHAMTCAMAIEASLLSPESYDSESRVTMAQRAVKYRAFAEGRQS